MSVAPLLRRMLVGLGLLGFGVLSFAPAALAADGPAIAVCPSGCAYTSIQDAINAAPSGATITIAPGTYGGSLNIGSKNLKLAGAGASLTTISSGSPIVFVDSGTVTISGVTITGGSSEPGGGIINEGGTVTLTDSTVSGNGGIVGGILNGGTMTLNDSTVSGNTAGDLGDNIAGKGGGIANAGTLTLNDSTVSGNAAGGATFGSVGGGIYNDGTATLNDSTVSGNVAVNNGGGIDNDGTVTLNDSTVSGNTAVLGFGGGIYNDATATLKGSTVRCNTPDDISGPYTQKDGTVGGSCT